MRLLLAQRTRRITAPAVLLAGALALSGRAGAAVVFSDTLSGSSSALNPATYPTPTSTATGYDVASTKNASSSLAASSPLKISMGGTTSGVVEGQALFASAPVALNVGDTIEYTIVFTNPTTNGNLLAGGTNSALYMGLYNSAASGPVSGLQTSGLNGTTGSAFATGGTQLWQGYNARIVGSGGNNQVYTRPQQSGGANTTSAHQDLVGNNAGGGLYNDPAGSLVGGNVASTAALTAGSTYTDDLKITLNADGSLKIDSNLYTGPDTTGTNLATESVTTSTSPLTTSFDGLSFGYRQSGTSLPTEMDVNSITVQTLSTVPEPASLALLGIGGLAMLRRRK